MPEESRWRGDARVTPEIQLPPRSDAGAEPVLLRRIRETALLRHLNGLHGTEKVRGSVLRFAAGTIPPEGA